MTALITGMTCLKSSPVQAFKYPDNSQSVTRWRLLFDGSLYVVHQEYYNASSGLNTEWIVLKTDDLSLANRRYFYNTEGIKP